MGWSTNAIRLPSNEYLVGLHAVLKSVFSYGEDIALLSDGGELPAVSDYLLVP